MMAMCLINVFAPLMADAPLGVEVGAGLKQIRVRNNNIVQRLTTELLGSGAI